MIGSPCITVQQVQMRYPIQRRLRDCLLRPGGGLHQTALEGLSFQIGAGERLALLGSNGSGKTTLLKLLGGLLYPTTGTITVYGHDTQRENLAARSRIGVVLNEDRSFYWRLTGRENLAFFGALDNLWGHCLADRIAEVLALVDLTTAADYQVAGYSSGMRQRLAIARALLADPDILLLDEPTRTLDPQAVDHFLEMMKACTISGQQRMLVLATHRFAEAEALCDRFLILAQGRVIADVSHREVLSGYGSLAACYHQTVAIQEGVVC